ncbi:hypothetical protein N0V83_010010 [Neocucurbitaria cava]|uniref:Ice-binding protein n=1 Tax=Neocucurbitaria cava TaxID=798079 RepID=A0A9W9CHQ9_9PLEO|nr:hypothetical protein N0V83_010010 [Neocucurbitaria cava]
MPILVLLHQLVDPAIAQIDLGTAAPFGIVANQAITNTGNTIVDGELGLYPNTASSITGFPPGISGDVSAGDQVANQAIQDAQTAYNAAAAQASTAQITGDLGGQTLVAGTYTTSTSAGITGTLTLDGQSDPDSLFVFQIGSTLTTATSASVVLINGAQACNIFWQVGSSATLGTSTVFNGNVLASTSISLDEGVTVNGGLYALTGEVTLIDDDVTAQQECTTSPTTTTSIASPTSISSVIITSTTGNLATNMPGAPDLPPVGPSGPTSESATYSAESSESFLTINVSTPVSTPVESFNSPSYAEVTVSAGLSAEAAVTTINGTPCTTSTYFEPTCACTKTTIVPIAYNRMAEAMTVDVATANGVLCTTTQYYEEACDCIRTSAVPLQVVSATASIATVINDVPCMYHIQVLRGFL